MPWSRGHHEHIMGRNMCVKADVRDGRSATTDCVTKTDVGAISDNMSCFIGPVWLCLLKIVGCQTNELIR